MATVRAKFVCDSINSDEEATIGPVRLRPVFSTDPHHENKQFWDATPMGELYMLIQNPDAYKQFVVGAEYYVDITLAHSDVDLPACPECGQYHVKLKRYIEHGKQFVVCPTTNEQIPVEE